MATRECLVQTTVCRIISLDEEFMSLLVWLDIFMFLRFEQKHNVVLLDVLTTSPGSIRCSCPSVLYAI